MCASLSRRNSLISINNNKFQIICLSENSFLFFRDIFDPEGLRIGITSYGYLNERNTEGTPLIIRIVNEAHSGPSIIINLLCYLKRYK